MCPPRLLVSLHSLGVVPVRVDEQRTLHSATFTWLTAINVVLQRRFRVTINFSQLVFRPGPAVSEIAQSDALLHGGLGLLVCQLPSLLLQSSPHDGQTEVHPHPSGHHVLSKCCALQVHKAKEGLSVLQIETLTFLIQMRNY